MLSERERRRLHEIEMQLRLTDPRLVRRFSALRPAGRRGMSPGRLPGVPRGLPGVPGGRRGGRSLHRAGPIPTVLLVVALLVLLLGAVAVSVPVVLAGIVLAGMSLGVAATTGPR